MTKKIQKFLFGVIVLLSMAGATDAQDLESGPYISNPVLESSDTVEGYGKLVFFAATEKIILKPGFKVGAGARFSARIGDFTGLDSNIDSDNDGLADWMEYAVTGNLTLSYIPDSIPPNIMILGDNPVVHLLGESYTDPGATALDNMDGDLTSAINVQTTVNINQAGQYTVTYNVSDSAGNTAPTVQRIVKVLEAQCYNDVTKPVITILGANPIVQQLGRAYTDPGATVIDYCDGDLTNQITLSGSVNTNQLGDYTLTYNVSDSSGNSALPVQRIVKVEENVICDEMIQINTTYDYDAGGRLERIKRDIY